MITALPQRRGVAGLGVELDLRVREPIVNKIKDDLYERVVILRTCPNPIIERRRPQTFKVHFEGTKHGLDFVTPLANAQLPSRGGNDQTLSHLIHQRQI